MIVGCDELVIPSSLSEIDAVVESGTIPSEVSLKLKASVAPCSKDESKVTLLGSTLSEIRVSCTNELPPSAPAALPPPAAVASKLSKMSPSPSNASKKSVTSELAAVDGSCSAPKSKLAIASSKLSSKTVVSLESLASFANKSGVIFTF